MYRVGYLAALGLMLASAPATAASTFFSTGGPDGKLAALSRPGSPGAIETETADDFVLSGTTRITGASFFGLLTQGAMPADVGKVVVEIYRVFPQDSDIGRMPQVPTRVNSPSDVALDSRDSTSDLTFTTTVFSGPVTAANSVADGIHPAPNQFTGGDGPVTGAETLFSTDFSTPFLLQAGHYFFVPQVQIGGNGSFLWLSAPRPIMGGGTTPFAPDLQAWIRNEDLAPDWLRIGTDITHSGPFNMSFSLDGAAVPEPGTWALMLLGVGGVGAVLRRAKARAVPV